MKFTSNFLTAVIATLSTVAAQSPEAYSDYPPLVTAASGGEVVTTSVVYVDFIPAISISTLYSTSFATVYSCPSEVTNCPVSSSTISVQTAILAVSTTVCPVTLTSTGTSEVVTAGALPPTSATSGVVSAASEEGSPSSYTLNGSARSSLQTLTRTGTSTVTITSQSSIATASIASNGAASFSRPSDFSFNLASTDMAPSSTDAGVASAESFPSLTEAASMVGPYESASIEFPSSTISSSHSFVAETTTTGPSSLSSEGASSNTPVSYTYSPNPSISNSEEVGPDAAASTSAIKTSIVNSVDSLLPYGHTSKMRTLDSNTVHPLGVTSSIKGQMSSVAIPSLSVPYAYTPGATVNSFVGSSSGLPSYGTGPAVQSNTGTVGPTSGSNGTVQPSSLYPTPYMSAGAGLVELGSSITLHLCFAAGIIFGFAL